MADPADAVRPVVEEAVATGPELGLQVVAYLDGELVVDVWAGLADPDDQRPMTAETICTVFSATKAVAATALHVQAERGLIEYTAPIATYWPEFAAYGKGEATVLDALTHRTGVPQMPEGVTAEDMCVWDGMVESIAALEPLWEPGKKTGYHAYTFGWIVGELVRRTDPETRPFSRFVQEEICDPLGMDSFWMGIPDSAEARCATLINTPPPAPDAPLPDPDALILRAIPPQIGVVQEVFGRADVRRACIPGAGGITNARSLARHYAMLACGGTLDGVRLLSEERVRQIRTKQAGPDDEVIPMAGPLKGMGYFLGGNPASIAGPMGANPNAFGHPGAGGSIGWAEPDRGLGVAIVKNRMLASAGAAENRVLAIANAVRAAFGFD